MLKERSALDEETGEKIQAGISKALSKYMFGKLREGKDAYLEARKNLASEPIQDLDKMLALSDMYYYRALSDWNNYVKSVEFLVEEERGGDAGFLNSVAWTLYESVDAKEKELLEKGLSWIRKAAELKKDYAILDTYAALLYKAGYTEKAHEMALEAIRTAKESGEDFSDTEKLMEKYEN
jgi:tetratricopeptide (TPR) repeat protein